MNNNYLQGVYDTPVNTLTGGHVSYYFADIKNPSRKDKEPYVAEADDIIKALKLNFMEGCIFKEIWRTANARLGNGKLGHTEEYGKDKIKHYANLL